MASKKNTNREPALKREINRFVLFIAIIAVSTGIVLAIIWAAWLRVDYPTFLTTSGIISTVLGIIVAFVPEGLPGNLFCY